MILKRRWIPLKLLSLIHSNQAEREQTRFACRELSNQEVLARIQEVVSARFQAIEQEFKNADSTRTNLVSKELFRDICNRRFLLLTDEQVRKVGIP